MTPYQISLEIYGGFYYPGITLTAQGWFLRCFSDVLEGLCFFFSYVLVAIYFIFHILFNLELFVQGSSVNKLMALLSPYYHYVAWEAQWPNV